MFTWNYYNIADLLYPHTELKSFKKIKKKETMV